MINIYCNYMKKTVKVQFENPEDMTQFITHLNLDGKVKLSILRNVRMEHE
jgi:hypothetical protein